MNAIRGWIYGGKPEDSGKPQATPAPSASTPIDANLSTPVAQANPQVTQKPTVSIPPQQQILLPGGLPLGQPQPIPVQAQQQQRNESSSELHQAVDRVNETKSIYDQCEARRMTAVINGKDAQDYSCEREFAAFKKAFDLQLALESKMPVSGQGQ